MGEVEFQLEYDPKRNYTFVVNCPDGIAYAVTLVGWYWNLIAYIGHRYPNVTREEFFLDAFKVAEEDRSEGTYYADGSVQGELTAHAMIYADRFLRLIEEFDRGYANDQPEASERR